MNRSSNGSSQHHRRSTSSSSNNPPSSNGKGRIAAGSAGGGVGGSGGGSGGSQGHKAGTGAGTGAQTVDASASWSKVLRRRARQLRSLDARQLCEIEGLLGSDPPSSSPTSSTLPPRPSPDDATIGTHVEYLTELLGRHFRIATDASLRGDLRSRSLDSVKRLLAAIDEQYARGGPTQPRQRRQQQQQQRGQQQQQRPQQQQRGQQQQQQQGHQRQQDGSGNRAGETGGRSDGVGPAKPPPRGSAAQKDPPPSSGAVAAGSGSKASSAAVASSDRGDPSNGGGGAAAEVPARREKRAGAGPVTAATATAAARTDGRSGDGHRAQIGARGAAPETGTAATPPGGNIGAEEGSVSSRSAPTATGGGGGGAVIGSAGAARPPSPRPQDQRAPVGAVGAVAGGENAAVVNKAADKRNEEGHHAQKSRKEAASAAPPRTGTSAGGSVGAKRGSSASGPASTAAVGGGGAVRPGAVGNTAADQNLGRGGATEKPPSFIAALFASVAAGGSTGDGDGNAGSGGCGSRSAVATPAQTQASAAKMGLTSSKAASASGGKKKVKPDAVPSGGGIGVGTAAPHQPHPPKPPPPQKVVAEDFQAESQTTSYSAALTSRIACRVFYRPAPSTASPDRTLRRSFEERLDRWDPYWGRVHDVVDFQLDLDATDDHGGGGRVVEVKDSGYFVATSAVVRTEPELYSSSPGENQPRTCLAVTFQVPREVAAERGSNGRSMSWGTVCGSFGRQPEDGERRLLVRMLPLVPPTHGGGGGGRRADTHLWPKGTFLQVNGRPIRLKQRKQQSHDPKLWKGMCEPLDLTPLVADPGGRNTLSLLTRDDAPYGVQICVVEYRGPRSLLSSAVASKEVIPYDVAVEMARRYVGAQTVVLDDSDDDDDDGGGDGIGSSSSLTWQLTCPMAMRTMEVPARGRNCRHMQCFDLFTFLHANSFPSGRRWMCPACDEFVSLDDVVLCGLFREMIRRHRGEVDNGADRVNFWADGTWKLAPTKKRGAADGEAVIRGTKRKKAPEIILL